jgi:outer membrane protein assembly factor BamB
VYVAFADQEHFYVAAYGFDGTLAWRRNLGPYESQHGLGASLIVYEGLVFVPNDQDGPSSLVALDSETGRTIWSTLRPFDMTSYATPMIVRPNGGAAELIASSSALGVAGLDPLTGRLIWHTGKFEQRTVSSPILAGGLVVQTTGGGGRGTYMLAVDPTGAGNVSATHVRFTRDRELPYVPTPVVFGDYVYLWGDGGVVSCISAHNWDNIWTKRIPTGGNYSGSPICIDGKLYCLSEAGEVVVLAAEPKFRHFGTMPLGDPSHATPAVANGRLYLRTFHRLACLEAKP